LQVHAGRSPTYYRFKSGSIYQTTSYVFNSPEHAANLFALKEPGNIYTRIMNPQLMFFEQRMALWKEESERCGGFRFGAITYAILNIAGAEMKLFRPALFTEEHIIFLRQLYRGLELKLFCRPDDPENFRKAINEKTKLFILSLLETRN